MKIIVINGPNINMTGKREPGVYGSRTLEQINTSLADLAGNLGIELSFMQSNHEGVLVDALQNVSDAYDGAILNAGAYTHTSVALRDAVLSINKPVLEVHFSNPAARESFRHTSFLAGAVKGSIAGFGEGSYHLALLWFYTQRKGSLSAPL